MDRYSKPGAMSLLPVWVVTAEILPRGVAEPTDISTTEKSRSTLASSRVCEGLRARG